MGGASSSPAPASLPAVRGQLPPGQEMGRFKCSYLGFTTFDGRMRSNEFIAQATRRVLDAKLPPLQITLRLSDTGVFLLQSDNLVAEVALSDLSNVTQAGGNRVAYLQRDRKTGILACHLFQVARNAAQLCELINSACSSNAAADDDLEDNTVHARTAEAERPEKAEPVGPLPRSTSTPSRALSLSSVPSSPSLSSPESQSAPSPAFAPSRQPANRTMSTANATPSGGNGGGGGVPAHLARSHSVATSSPTTMPEPSLAAPVVTGPTHTFHAKYVGCVSVQSSSGVEVVADALRQLKKKNKDGRKKPIPVAVQVNSFLVQLAHEAANSTVFSCKTDEISFYFWDSARKKHYFSFIVLDSEGAPTCHFLKFPKSAHPLHQALAVAFIEAGDRRKKGGAGPQSMAATVRNLTQNAVQAAKGAPLGLFEACYLGGHPVAATKGHEVVISGLEDMLAKPLEPAMVALSVSSEGIRAMESLTAEMVVNTLIKDVSFTAIVDDARILKKVGKLRVGDRLDETLFTFIATDERLQRTTLEVFCAGSRSKEILATINVAFQLAAEEHRRSKGNAFTATDPSRDPVPRSLFTWQIHRKDLEPVRVIGSGQFGEVYLATQRITIPGKAPFAVPRAVKLLRNAATAANKAEFIKEAEIMTLFNHQNLLKLAGVAVQQRPWLVVLEYMEYGDLRSVVRTCRERALALTYLEHLKLCVQIARGMAYLSGLRYIHMDLAARNCLMTNRNLVRIGDFGLTRTMDEGVNYFRLTTTLKLPIKWMAVESMEDKIFSAKTDVWAFGILMWELFSYGVLPFANIPNAEVQGKVMGGLRLERPRGCPSELFALCERCWLRESADRPSFTEMFEIMMYFASRAKARCPPMRDIGFLLREGPKGLQDPRSTITEDVDFNDAELEKHKRRPARTGIVIVAPTGGSFSRKASVVDDDTAEGANDVFSSGAGAGAGANGGGGAAAATRASASTPSPVFGASSANGNGGGSAVASRAGAMRAENGSAEDASSGAGSGMGSGGSTARPSEGAAEARNIRSPGEEERRGGGGGGMERARAGSLSVGRPSASSSGAGAGSGAASSSSSSNDASSINRARSASMGSAARMGRQTSAPSPAGAARGGVHHLLDGSSGVHPLLDGSASGPVHPFMDGSERPVHPLLDGARGRSKKSEDGDDEDSSKANGHVHPLLDGEPAVHPLVNGGSLGSSGAGSPEEPSSPDADSQLSFVAGSASRGRLATLLTPEEKAQRAKMTHVEEDSEDA